MRIGHARNSENNNTVGKAGDQTGKEVAITEYYKGGWNVVIRLNDTKQAEKAAKAIEEACNNDNIGYNWYGQDDRLSLYRQWQITKDLTKVKPCNCDCSSLVSLACIIAGVNISPDNNTRTLKKALESTGKVTCFTSSAYTNNTSLLKRGDILLKEGTHTAVVLDNGVQRGDAIQTAYKVDKTLTGAYTTTCDLHLRYGAGASNYDSIVVMPKGTKVANYGYYNEVEGVKWLCVQTTIKGVQYTGYCSSKYLKKN